MKILIAREYFAKTFYCEHKIMVDDEDHDRLSPFLWRRNVNGYYSATVAEGQHVTLHRFVMGCTDSRHTHHKDLNKDNNTKSNLTLCTKEEHAALHSDGKPRRPKRQSVTVFFTDGSEPREYWPITPIAPKVVRTIKGELLKAQRLGLILLVPGAGFIPNPNMAYAEANKQHLPLTEYLRRKKNYDSFFGIPYYGRYQLEAEKILSTGKFR